MLDVRVAVRHPVLSLSFSLSTCLVTASIYGIAPDVLVSLAGNHAKPTLGSFVFAIRQGASGARRHDSTFMRRKNIAYKVTAHDDLLEQVLGDPYYFKQAISSITANAIWNTSHGNVAVDMFITSQGKHRVNVDILMEDYQIPPKRRL